MSKKAFIFTMGAIAAIYFAAHFYFQGLAREFLADESSHAWQIDSFFRNDYQILPHLTVIPGYHFLLAELQTLFHNDTTAFKRLISVLIGLLSTGFFFALQGREHPQVSPVNKTWQFAFNPVYFPFFFLIYTDPLSLLLILAALYFGRTKRYFFMGLSGIFSLLVRQNNIFWIGFLIFLTLREAGINWRRPLKSVQKNLIAIIKINWLNLIAGAGFLTFLISNGGVALGDRTQHPSFAFHTGNLYLALILTVIIYLPFFLSRFPEILRTGKKWLGEKLSALIFGLSLVGGSLFFWFDFEVTHIYNRYPQYWWFLRNIFLHAAENNLWLKGAFLFALIYGILALIATPFRSQSLKIAFFTFSALTLLPSWLIEVRYAIIPIALFQLYRQEADRSTEVLQSVWQTALSFILLSTVFHTVYFP